MSPDLPGLLWSWSRLDFFEFCFHRLFRRRCELGFRCGKLCLGRLIGFRDRKYPPLVIYGKAVPASQWRIREPKHTYTSIRKTWDCDGVTWAGGEKPKDPVGPAASQFS